MGRVAHKHKTKRKLITLDEWAFVLRMSRQTVAKRIKGYEARYKTTYDCRDMYSVLRVHEHLLS